MTSTSIRALGLTMLATLAGAAMAAQPDEVRLDEQARALHQRLLVLDSHVDLLLPDTPGRYADKDGQSQASLAKLQAGGVNAIVLALAVGPGPRDAAGVATARAEVEAKRRAIDEFLAASAGKAVLATSASAIEAAHAAGRIAVIPGFLNARSLGTDVGAIDALYAQGVRVFGLTHAGHNDWADSSRPSGGPVQEHGGLSAIGRAAIPRLNDRGIVIDVSQLTPAGVSQVLAASRAPVIASHSAVRALVDNTRNLSDAELDAIGRKGGTVQVPAFNAYLKREAPDFPAKARAIRTRYGLPAEYPAGASANDGYPSLPADRQGAFNDELTTARGRATVADLVDHIDYIARRIGADHVGIGSDFNHGAGIVGFQSEAEAQNITRELLRRGYDEKQIAGIWGGNFLRVLRAVEAAAVRK